MRSDYAAVHWALDRHLRAGLLKGFSVSWTGGSRARPFFLVELADGVMRRLTLGEAHAFVMGLKSAKDALDALQQQGAAGG